MMFRIKELRTRYGFSQKDVAERLGMPVRRYGSYEREERSLALEDAAMIADVFGCTLDELAGREWSPSEYSDPRQAELNRCWDECEEGDRTAILRVAKSFAAQEKSDGAPPGRGDPVPSQAIA